jgi:hypothetical protein
MKKPEEKISWDCSFKLGGIVQLLVSATQGTEGSFTLITEKMCIGYGGGGGGVSW